MLTRVAPTVVAPQGRAASDDTFGAIRAWMTYLEVSGEANQSTRRQYRRAIIALLAELLIHPLAITEDDLVGYLASLSERGGMRGQTIKATRSLCRWALARELIEKDPTARMNVRKGRPGPVRALDPEHLEALLHTAERVDPRARWALQLAYATGARVGSLCALMPEDVMDGQVFFRRAKNDAPYAVPLGPKAREAVEHLMGLMDYRPRRVVERRATLVGVGETQVWNWCRRAADLAGLHVTTHDLRRTFGTRLAEDPAVSLSTWVTLMNHADATQFRRYTRASAPALREAVGRL